MVREAAQMYKSQEETGVVDSRNTFTMSIRASERWKEGFNE